MPLNNRIVGQTTEPVTHDVDARWLMAYAAGLDDPNPAYMDTAAATLVAHPVFPVCLEWPVILSSRDLPGFESMTTEENARGVHAAHDVHLYRPIRAGERLTTRATVTTLEQLKPGAAQMLRIDTTDEAGEPVCRTHQLTIHRGVAVEGEAVVLEVAPGWPERIRSGRTRTFPLPVRAGAAHVYTECARIWNPIHTDRAVALEAGLPDIILHGTATMAMAVSRLVDEYLAGDAARVSRLGGRFAAMVLMPCVLNLEVEGETEDTLFFTVRTQAGEPAFQNGFLCFRAE